MLLVVIMMVMSLIDLTPGVFKEYEAVKQVSHSFRQQRRILVFWRRRRIDTAGKAIAALEDTRPTFSGAPDGKHEEMCGVRVSRLKVKVFVQDRAGLKHLLQQVDLAVMPSRTEGFKMIPMPGNTTGSIRRRS